MVVDDLLTCLDPFARRVGWGEDLRPGIPPRREMSCSPPGWPDRRELAAARVGRLTPAVRFEFGDHHDDGTHEESDPPPVRR